MINNTISKHHKNQLSVPKSSKKSRHKHEYKEVLLINNEYPHWATVCKTCGKVGDLHLFETEQYCNGVWRQLDSDEVFEKYKDLEKYYIEDIWQKYVSVSQEGGE